MKNQKSRMQSINGITLIALVITIIILLILAGISINALVNNGIMDKGKTATQEYKNAQDNEETQIAKYTNEINDYISSSRDYETKIEELRQETKIQHTMSGTEHFTGEYYLNGKPIYEKTFYISSLPNKSSEKTYNHGIADVDFICFDYIKSYAIFTSGNICSIPYLNAVDSSSEIGISGLNKTSFLLSVGADRSSVSAYITLRYTKTTDAATISPSVTTLTPNS